MAYVGWAVDVNKIILDSASINIGDGATVSDNLETGGKTLSRLSCFNPPDKFSVEMDFDWVKKDTNGLTEKDRFFNWYKYTLKYSANSFQFPSILLNSNNSTGEDTEQVSYKKDTSYEWYRITSAVGGNKSGNSIKLKMTWITDSVGIIEIPAKAKSVDHIESHNGYIDIILLSKPDTEPTTNDFGLDIDGTSEAITHFIFDGSKLFRIYFTSKTVTGTYSTKIWSSTYSFVTSSSGTGTFIVS